MLRYLALQHLPINISKDEGTGDDIQLPKNVHDILKTRREMKPVSRQFIYIKVLTDQKKSRREGNYQATERKAKKKEGRNKIDFNFQL